MASKVETLISDWGRIPYSLALSSVRLSARRLPKGSLVWPRNSFLTFAFRPLKSDLDLTVWLEAQPSSKTIAQLRWLLKINKVLFPILGESNVYIRPFAGFMAGLVNRYELARDPELERMLKEDLTKKAASSKALKRVTTKRAEKCVFLLRMLEADLQNLRTAPKRRKQKWRMHLTSVGVKSDKNSSIVAGENPIRKILETAFHFFEDSEFEKRATDMVESYLQARSEGVPDHKVTVTPELLAIFPQRFCFLEVSKKLSGQALKEIFMAQVAWEIWGIMGQFPLLRQPKAVLVHLTSLKKCLAVAGKTTSELEAAIIKISLALKNRNKTL